jgi:hypothetical protein
MIDVASARVLRPLCFAGGIMGESPQQITEIKASRPALVWVITIFYFVSFVFTALSFVLVYSGKYQSTL